MRAKRKSEQVRGRERERVVTASGPSGFCPHSFLAACAWARVRIPHVRVFAREKGLSRRRRRFRRIEIVGLFSWIRGTRLVLPSYGARRRCYSSLVQMPRVFICVNWRSNVYVYFICDKAIVCFQCRHDCEILLLRLCVEFEEDARLFRPSEWLWYGTCLTHITASFDVRNSSTIIIQRRLFDTHLQRPSYSADLQCKLLQESCNWLLSLR